MHDAALIAGPELHVDIVKCVQTKKEITRRSNSHLRPSHDSREGERARRLRAAAEKASTDVKESTANWKTA